MIHQSQLEVMPWRSKTLTEYRLSEVASPDSSDRLIFSDGTGLDFDAQRQSVETSDLFSNADKFCDGTGILGDKCFGEDLVLESPTGFDSFEAQHASKDNAVLALGASEVPRGPVISESSFEQMLTHAYIVMRGPLTVKMPWEKGVFKQIFNSNGKIFLKLQSKNGSASSG